jgi:hypothetical protein
MSSDTSRQKANGIRINELCRELEVKAKVLIDYLPSAGVTEKKTHSSWISLDAAELVRKHFRELAEAEVADQGEKTRPTAAVSPPTLPAGLTIRQTHIGTSAIRPPISGSNPVVLRLPRKFTFHRGFMDFDYVFGCFDWSLKDVPVLAPSPDYGWSRFWNSTRSNVCTSPAC